MPWQHQTSWHRQLVDRRQSASAVKLKPGSRTMETCFPCLGVKKRRESPAPAVKAIPGDPLHHHVAAAARTFCFKELAAATRNFRDDCLVADKEAALYKGYLKSVNQVVAIKLQHAADWRRSSEKCNSEFLAHALKLSGLRHPNLVSLIGFCADGNHRILVHEYKPLGSLEDYLHDPSPDKARLDWNTRMQIAAGAAKGLEYLHQKGLAYRCMRSSDILLEDGDGYHPKLSQYGLAELDQLLFECNNAAFTKQYFGFSAPDIAMTGKLSAASSLYNLGVVLLEMITGRRAFDQRAAQEDQSLVRWARPLVKYRPAIRLMADPALQGRYPLKDFERAVAVAFMCIQQDPAMRPPIGDVVKALAFLASNRSSQL